MSEADRDGPPPAGFDRRRALELLLAGSGLGMAVLLGIPVARYLGPGEPTPPEPVELEADGLGPWEARTLVLSGRPAVVVRTEAGYAALSAVCSHLGCTVKWKKARRQFFCPCHGGRFALDGSVVGGPPREALEPLEVEELPGKIVVRPA